MLLEKFLELFCEDRYLYINNILYSPTAQ